MKKFLRAGKIKTLVCSSLAAVLVAAGIFLALFPFLTDIHNRYFVNGSAPVFHRLLEDSNAAVGPAQPAALNKVNKGTVQVPPEGSGSEGSRPEKILPQEGVLRIPALDLKIRVVYGVTPEKLKIAPGFYPQSDYPGSGNVSIAGHRNIYGSWFRRLDDLKRGDEIYLYYNKRAYIYSVASVFETHSRDWSVIDTTPEAALTLTTCQPGLPSKRLIVRAYLNRSF